MSVVFLHGPGHKDKFGIPDKDIRYADGMVHVVERHRADNMCERKAR